MVADTIRFLRRGIVVSHRITNPMQTVLDYLRLEEKSRGTKEGCNEGDCGACTVALGRLRDGKVVYEPVNACILLMGHLHGCELVTVDDLANAGQLHPVQQAMVDAHASQCGYCTPGFVMSLFTLYHVGQSPDRQAIVDQIAGNLCRCTGYKPIIAAAAAACASGPDDVWSRLTTDIADQLKSMNDGSDVWCETDGGIVAIPGTADALCSLAQKHPDAVLVAGATDVSLWITKQLRDLKKLIFLGGVAQLRTISDRTATLSLGASVTYAEAEQRIGAIAPDLKEVVRRIGSKQIRSSGTIGGNIANGSPIGDMPPMLIALGARLMLRLGHDQRTIDLEKFFIDYGRQDRKPGELVWRIDIPKLNSNERFFAHKISKRFDQDISSVMAAFKFSMAGRSIATARVAFGGMAATPRRAPQTEAALQGLKLDAPETWDDAIACLARDYAPISDMRATASYRIDCAQALLRKALLELVGEDPAHVRILAPAAKEAWT